MSAATTQDVVLAVNAGSSTLKFGFCLWPKSLAVC